MTHEIVDVFKMVSQLKGFDFSQYEEEQEYYIKAFYPALKKAITYKKWNQIVRRYSLETGEDIYESCDILQSIICEKYNL